MRVTAWLRKQPTHIQNALKAALVGIIIEALVATLTVLGIIPTWGPAAIVLFATLVVSGGLYQMPENEGIWGD